MQEQVDKERIALYGVLKHSDYVYPDGQEQYPMGGKGIKMPNYGLGLHLSQQCLSCSGQQATLQKALKLACLTYKASQVPYKGKSYERQDLIMKKAQLITPENNFGTHKEHNSPPQAMTLEKQANVLKEFINSIAHKRLKSTYHQIPGINISQNITAVRSTGVDLN